jgi:hypothetical protein
MQSVLGSLLLVATLTACSSEYDWLVAEYTVQPDAPALVKVTKSGNNYLASIRLGPDWSAPLRLKPCGDADYAHQFGSGWKDVQPVGLCARRDEKEAYPFGIFKVQQGARARQHRFRTGYFVEFGGAGHGSGDLFRLSAGQRRRPVPGFSVFDDHEGVQLASTTVNR